MRTTQNENGFFAIGKDGYSTSQYFATLEALETAITAEKTLCDDQGIDPDYCVPANSPLHWSY